MSVGYPGSCSDAGIFRRCRLKKKLDCGTLGIPPPEPLHPAGRPVPYFFVGDDAFPLTRWLMKPFPQRGLSASAWIFNYRLSRARRYVKMYNMHNNI